MVVLCRHSPRHSYSVHRMDIVEEEPHREVPPWPGAVQLGPREECGLSVAVENKLLGSLFINHVPYHVTYPPAKLITYLNCGDDGNSADGAITPDNHAI